MSWWRVVGRMSCWDECELGWVGASLSLCNGGWDV